MNFGRLALGAVAAWIAYVAIGFVVNTMILADVYAQHIAANVMRPPEAGNALVPIGLVMGLLGFFVFAYAYAKGYEGGQGVQEGLRFGVVVALLLICFALIWEYVVFPISGRLLAYWVVDLLVEFAIYGMIVGAIYKPAVTPAGR